MAKMAPSYSLHGLPAALLCPLASLAEGIDRTALPIKLDRDRTSLTDYSVLSRAIARLDLQTIPGVAKKATREQALLALVQQAVAACPAVDRAVGAMVGNALGDALGHPLEFLAVNTGPLIVNHRSYLDPEHVTAQGTPLYRMPLNRFRLQPGQWTDDFAMAMCLADSLLVKAQYDGRDARIRWYNWWNRGYNNAFRFDPDRARGRGSVGLGGNVMNSLDALKKYEGKEDQVPPYHDAPGEDAGNGSIMRLSPVPVMFHATPALAEQVADQQSRGTHPGGDAAACCRFLAHFCAAAIRTGPPPCAASGPNGGTPTQLFMNEVVDGFLKTHDMGQSPAFRKLQRLLQSAEPKESLEYCWNWRMADLPIRESIRSRMDQGSYNGYNVRPDYFGSYCFDGLAMALWGVYYTTTFVDAIIKVVNLLGDADSTGAVAGQLAGALYGYSGIQVGGRCVTDEAGKAVKAASMGELWLTHLRRWDPFSEIPLKAILLYTMQPTTAPDHH